MEHFNIPAAGSAAPEQPLTPEQTISIIRKSLEILERTTPKEENPGSDTEEVVQLVNYVKPGSLLLPTTKVSRKLYDGETDFTDGVQPIDISRKNQKGKFIVPAKLVFMPTISQEGLEIPRHLTPFDKQVQNGIFTLIENGYTAFTAKQVYEAFAGKTTSEKLAIERVTDSITKQRLTLIGLDWTAHAKMKGLLVDQQRGDYVAKQENLLLLSRVKVRCGGQDLDGYTVIRKPILYRYAKAVGQLATIDRKLLDVPVNNTVANIVLKNELLERIDTMKRRKRNVSNTILFETLYKIAEVGEGGVERSRSRAAIKKMLNTWKKEKFISGYTLNKTGPKIVSVTVHI